MKIWVIGDIHGCAETLVALIAKMSLGPCDKVISIGDLINRGPHSAKVLDIFMSDSRFSAILGNHDWAFILSKLARIGPIHKDFRDLAASSRSLIWISWLRKQPFAKTIGNYFLTHAGCWPEWDIQEHQRYADRVHEWFKRASIADLALLDSYLGKENAWSEQSLEKAPIKAYAFIINVLTKMRYLNYGQPLSMNLSLKGLPSAQPNHQAWFEAYPSLENKTIVFGHWSALRGLQRPGFQGLDTGCSWGESLSALELHSGQRIIQPALEKQNKQSD